MRALTPGTINHLGISGGKDSTALLLWAVHESGYHPSTIRATFADTGNEHPLTYDYVRMLSEKVHPIIWLTPDLDFYELAKKKNRFPSPKARFCTEHLKLIPSKRYLYALLDAGFSVLSHTGVRAGESAARASLSPHGMDSYSGVPVLRPLLSWTIEDVWSIHARYGIPPNPLYAKGMTRVGCMPCIMSRKSEIRKISEVFPERISLIRAAELSTGKRSFSSFFSPGKVPAGHQSRAIECEDGRIVMVPTIDDVVRWSKTARGGQQYELDFGEEAPTCSHESGACE